AAGRPPSPLLRPSAGRPRRRPSARRHRRRPRGTGGSGLLGLLASSSWAILVVLVLPASASRLPGTRGTEEPSRFFEGQRLLAEAGEELLAPYRPQHLVGVLL